jgi:LmbE family N-acetylglucosaminyl deacetylase
MNIPYLTRRALTLWKRTTWVSLYLSKRLFMRLLSAMPLLSDHDNITPKPFTLANNARVMVLAPHSDDESIGCGGLILSYPQQMEVVCLTDGSRGDPSIPRDTLIAIREQELANALAFAGVKKFHFLGIADQGMAQGYDRFATLDLTQIDYVCVPNFLDQHPDHKAVTLLLQRLLKEKPYNPTLNIVFYEVWGALPVWNTYTQLDDQLLAQKHQMISHFVSQTKQINYAERLTGLHIYRGIVVGLPAVEAYLVMDSADFLALPA